MPRKVLFYKGKLYFSADTVYVPTKLSQLQNDVGYITSASIPTNVSAFTNDAGYLTSHQDISGKVNKAGDTMSGSLTCSTSGSNLKWGNTTIYGGGSDGGINSVIFGNDVTLGDCNVGGMMGMKSTGTNAGIRLYDSSGNLIGGFQSTNGTPQWCNSSGTLTTISLNGHTHSYLPLTGGTCTGHVWVKTASGESDIGVNNTNSGKNCYLFSNNSGTVGIYSNIGSSLVVLDTNKKLTIGGTSYEFGNRLKFAEALTNQSISSPQFVVGLTNNWGTFGYTSIANLKTTLGLGSMAYQNTGSWYPMSGGQLNGSMAFKATNLNKDASNIQTWSNKEINWFDNYSKRLGGLNVRQYSGSTRYFGFEWWCEDGNGNWNSLRLINYVSESKYSVTSPINFRAAIGAAASSSRLYKTNIQDMDENEAKKILDIGVKSFDYKEGFVHECDKKDKYYGIIAEEAIEKLPYVVNVPKDYDETKFNEKEGMLQKILTVDYANFVPYLIKMVQIQQREIDELREICASCTKNN